MTYLFKTYYVTFHNKKNEFSTRSRTNPVQVPKQ